MTPIAVTELADLVAAHRGPRPALLLDVREDWEVALGRIDLPGADHLEVPMSSVPQRLGELDAAQPIVCICHHGMRSAQVAAFLEHHGFGTVYNLSGGTDAWSAQVDPRLPRY